MTEYEPYGARHFLRAADTEGASELRRRSVTLVNGGTLPKGSSADTDAFRLGGLMTYRTLVLRSSPAQSRPPSPYRLTWRGRYYEVWQRPPGSGGSVIRHLGLGSGFDPGGVARCAAVRRLARTVPAARQPDCGEQAAGLPHSAPANPTPWRLGRGGAPGQAPADDARDARGRPAVGPAGRLRGLARRLGAAPGRAAGRPPQRRGGQRRAQQLRRVRVAGRPTPRPRPSHADDRASAAPIWFRAAAARRPWSDRWSSAHRTPRTRAWRASDLLRQRGSVAGAGTGSRRRRPRHRRRRP